MPIRIPPYLKTQVPLRNKFCCKDICNEILNPLQRNCTLWKSKKYSQPIDFIPKLQTVSTSTNGYTRNKSFFFLRCSFQKANSFPNTLLTKKEKLREVWGFMCLYIFSRSAIRQMPRNIDMVSKKVKYMWKSEEKIRNLYRITLAS